MSSQSDSAKPLMPKATAVWLIENTGLTFRQIGAFCGLLICLLSLEIITGDLRWGECLTLPCYGVTLLGGVVRPAGIMNTQHGSTP